MIPDRVSRRSNAGVSRPTTGRSPARTKKETGLRRWHHKSRTGCTPCKSRRVKVSVHVPLIIGKGFEFMINFFSSVMSIGQSVAIAPRWKLSVNTSTQNVPKNIRGCSQTMIKHKTRLPSRQHIQHKQMRPLSPAALSRHKTSSPLVFEHQ